MLYMHFNENLPLEYKNNPVSLLTTYCFNKDSMNDQLHSNPKSEESRNDSGR